MLLHSIFHTILCYSILYYTILDCAVLCYTVLNCMLCYARPCMLCYAVLCYRWDTIGLYKAIGRCCCGDGNSCWPMLNIEHTQRLIPESVLAVMCHSAVLRLGRAGLGAAKKSQGDDDKGPGKAPLPSLPRHRSTWPIFRAFGPETLPSRPHPRRRGGEGRGPSRGPPETSRGLHLAFESRFGR